jgi:hypothetical protein
MDMDRTLWARVGGPGYLYGGDVSERSERTDVTVHAIGVHR